MEITNEEKAKEIANDNCTHICLADCSAESYFGSENDCYKAAMEMAQWKDELFAKEKRQLIDKAWDWLTNQKGEHTKEDFIKAMKGEQSYENSYKK